MSSVDKIIPASAIALVKILNLTLQDQAVHPNYQLGP